MSIYVHNSQVGQEIILNNNFNIILHYKWYPILKIAFRTEKKTEPQNAKQLPVCQLMKQ